MKIAMLFLVLIFAVFIPTSNKKCVNKIVNLDFITLNNINKFKIERGSFYPNISTKPKNEDAEKIESHFSNLISKKYEKYIYKLNYDAYQNEKALKIKGITKEYIKSKYPKAIKYIAQCLYGECRGCSKIQQAAVVWCILNRVDGYSIQNEKTILKVITAKNQFKGWRKRNPVWKNLEEMAIDVLIRWELEKIGVDEIGRVLPANYKWFSGYGGINHFRDSYKNGKKWNWSLPNPYS